MPKKTLLVMFKNGHVGYFDIPPDYEVPYPEDPWFRVQGVDGAVSLNLSEVLHISVKMEPDAAD